MNDYPKHARHASSQNQQSQQFRPSAQQRPVNQLASQQGGVSASEYSRGSWQKPKKKKRGVWKAIFIIALVVLLCSVGAIAFIFYTYWSGAKSYDNVTESAMSQPLDVKGTSLGDLTVDWDALRAINPDIVAWVFIPDTPVNYPVVWSAEKDYYLYRSFTGDSNALGGTLLPAYGTPYLHNENSSDLSDQLSVIQGHNLQNGEMFATIAQMASADVFNAHRDVYVLTPTGNYRLKSFSLVHCTAYDPLVQPNFATTQAMADYVQDKMDRSVVTPDPNTTKASDVKKMFAFSTCDNAGDMRYVLFCSVEEYANKNSVSSSGSIVDSGTAATVTDTTQQLASS